MPSITKFCRRTGWIRMSRWRTGTPRRVSSRRSSSIFCGALHGGSRGGRNASQLKRRKYRGGYDVLFDLSHPGDVFGRDTQCLSLVLRSIIGKPEMHDTVPDDDVGRPHVNPLLSLQCGEQLLADRAVIAVGLDCRLAPGHRQRPDEVGPADDPDELPV